MTLRKSILLLIALTTIAALVGCNSSSTPPITLSLNSVPTSLTVNSQTALVAAVDNDKANGGVVWSCTTSTGSGSCGTFNPATTKTGASTTYIAPAVISPTGTTITITATSATNSAISQSSQPITIVAATLASGNYVFSVSGWDYNDESPYTVTGVFTVAGGLITGGEQDFVDYYGPLQDTISAGASGCSAATVPLVSCLTTSADGNLQIFLVTNDPDLGVTIPGTDPTPTVYGVETLAGSVLPLNPGNASITEFDGSATGSGELQKQSASLTAAPGPGSYAFLLRGLDEGQNGLPMAVGGIINIDDLSAAAQGAPAGGTISGAGSIYDANDDFSTIQGGSFLGSSVTAPDTVFGRVTFTMNSEDFPQLILAGYLVSNSEIQLVETGDSFGGALGGVALAQTVPTGGFTAANAANTYVIGMQGQDGNFFLQSASQLTLASAGTVSGFLDYSDLSETLQAASPDPVAAAAFTVDTTGRVTIPDLNDSANEGGVAYNVQLYLDGNGHALALTLDDTDVMSGPGWVQSGASSIAATSFAGAYGMGVTGVDGGGNGPFDAVGPVAADGSGSFAGFSDVNWLDFSDPGPITVAGTPVSGTFSSNSNGIFSGSITGIDIVSCPAFGVGTDACAPDGFNFYLVDQYGDNIAIETDGFQLTFGYFLQQ